MKSLIIFLNELSFSPEEVLSVEAMLPYVLSTLAALRATRRIREDLVIAGQSPLSGVLLGDGTRPLATILRGDTYKDERRLLQSIDQRSPWDAYPAAQRPGDFQEVNFRGRAGTGMLWAKQNGSMIVSFSFPPNWGGSHVDAQFHEIDEGGNFTSSDIQIPNLSRLEHVAAHGTLIDEYGRTIAASSVVYEGGGFAIRMFFNDHDPPHFHVMMRRDTSETLARYAIQTLDVLSGRLPSALRARVVEWAVTRQKDLMRCWLRCRSGQHPLSLQD